MPLSYRVWGIPAVLSTGIPGNALRAFPGSFRNFSGISSGTSQPYWGYGPVISRSMKVVAKLPSSEFQKICRDLKEFGETMQVKASKEGIAFSVQGDMGTGNVLLKPRAADKAEDQRT